jgi:uncharacterized protein (TIGR02266 family)
MGDRMLRVVLVGDEDLPTDRGAVTRFEEDPLPPVGPEATEPAEGRPGMAAVERASKQRCPDCGGPVAWEADACPSCGYVYASGRPGAYTITRSRQAPRTNEKRRSARIPIDVPIIYRSPNVEFESTATDLSRGGLFIETEMTDPVGTTCALTLLPDGGPAVQIQAVVTRVETKGGARSAGLGVHFGSMSPEAHAWLVALLREARRT